MMVLRRKIGEAIRINDDIRIVVQDIQHGHAVRFAIDAPSDVAVHRLEIYSIIQQENRAANQGNALLWLKGSGNCEASDDAK